MKRKFIVVIVAVLVIFFSVIFILFNDNDVDKETNDIGNYGDWYGLLGHTNLLIFPEKIDDDAINVEYYYYNEGTMLSESCCVFLKCEYNSEDYEKEVERLGKIDNIKYCENIYDYESYVSMLGNEENEYALLCENKTIVYLFTRNYKDIENIDKVVNQKYLNKNSESGTKEESFSIYQFDNHNNYKYWPESYNY